MPNPTAGALLGLLLDGGPQTGADLARHARVRIGGYWNVTRSQVYRELKGLEERGLVAPGTPGVRDARPFALTRAGEAAFRAWLGAFEPRESIRIGLLLLLSFGQHVDRGRLCELLARFAVDHRGRLAEYRDLDRELGIAGADPHLRATLSFGLHYERAVLAWLDEVAASLGVVLE